jgi:hypothetical protein
MIVSSFQADFTFPTSAPFHTTLLINNFIKALLGNSSFVQTLNCQVPYGLHSPQAIAPSWLKWSAPVQQGWASATAGTFSFISFATSFSRLHSDRRNAIPDLVGRTPTPVRLHVKLSDIYASISGGDAHVPTGADVKLQFHLLLTVDQLCHALIDLIEKLDELCPSA